MKFKDTLKTASRGLRTNKSRSALTMLGIIIGVSAIILIMSVGQGAENLILSQIRGLGSQTIIIEPGREPQGPSSFAEVFTDSLKERDIDALLSRSNVQGIKDLTPLVNQVMPVSFGSETIRINVLGASDLIAKILDVKLDRGAFFTEEEIRQKANIAVLGVKTKEKLFGKSDAVGERIKIKDRTFRVLGVLSPKGQVALFNADDMIVVPYTTAQRYLAGINHYNAVMVRAENEDIVPRVARDIELTLRETHGIDDESKDDFHITTQADAAERVKTITGILTALLSSVAAISLVVGGIGIMNIMLVSITERTREIGFRKALGATEKDILSQFLLESVMLTAAGGIIGIALGAGLSFFASAVLSRAVSLGWSFSFPVSAALLGFAVAASVGVLFGIYPARKASLKDPIEALRYE